MVVKRIAKPSKTHTHTHIHISYLPVLYVALQLAIQVSRVGLLAGLVDVMFYSVMAWKGFRLTYGRHWAEAGN